MGQRVPSTDSEASDDLGTQGIHRGSNRGRCRPLVGRRGFRARRRARV